VTSTPEEAEKNDEEKESCVTQQGLGSILYMALWRFCCFEVYNWEDTL
jgi:hypothetical protein